MATAPVKTLSAGLTGEECRIAARPVRAQCDPGHSDSSAAPLSSSGLPFHGMLEAAIVLELVLGKYTEAAVIGVLLVLNYR